MRALVLLGLALVAASLPVAPASGAACASTGPANDCLAAATPWFGKPERFSNAAATLEAGEPTACGDATVHASVWFEVEVVEPGTDDVLGIVLDAPFHATLGAYAKDAQGALTLLTCATSWEDEGLHSPAVFVPCTPGARYWIQVGGTSDAQQGAFELSEWSSFWNERCWFAPTLPTEPRLRAPVGGNGEIALTWVEPWWDGGRSAWISHYRVYRADACEGAFTLLGTTASRGWTDAGLPRATTYCYKVSAVNAVGEGPTEPGRSARTWDVPRPPRNLAAQPAGKGELNLSWIPSPDQAGPAPMSHHLIYRAASAEGPYALVGSADAAATGWLDAGLAPGTTMHYRVGAVSVVGEGAPSASASATTWRVPGAPRDVTVRHVLSAQPIAFEISWRAPEDPAPFTHYRVYRAASPDAAAQLVGEVPASATRLVDGHRGAFVDYHYEVRAWNPAGEGLPSARACIVYPFETALARCG